MVEKYNPILSNPFAAETPVFQKIFVVTNPAEAMQTLNMNPNGIDDITDLVDIDDDMEFNAEMPIVELPQRDFNVRTLTQDKLDEMRKMNK